MDADAHHWLLVGPVAELETRKKIVVTSGEHQILVLSHDGAVYAFENICIHRQRELSRGVIFGNRLVCAGHQWAFELGTGWEAVKQQCQPTYAVRVTDSGEVEVDVASRSTQAPAGCSPVAETEAATEPAS